MLQEKKAEPNPEKAAQRSLFWKRTVIGLSVVLVIGVAWRAVYVSNQKELKIRRALRKSQQLHDSLTDVPARRFSTVDVRPAAVQKNQLLERYD
jgi:hypothetical protein